MPSVVAQLIGSAVINSHNRNQTLKLVIIKRIESSTVADCDGGVDAVLLEIFQDRLECGLVHTRQLVVVQQNLSPVDVSR